jgi:ABC-type dipeptide/oligopeptide/nickel transport system permease component
MDSAASRSRWPGLRDRPDGAARAVPGLRRRGRGWARILLVRLCYLVVQVFVVLSAAFVILRLMPVDPVAHFASAAASPQAYAHVRHALGLDRPIIDQLGSYWKGVLHFNFGTSWSSGDSVGHDLLIATPVTLQLLALAFTLAIVIALPLGTAAGSRPGSRLDRAVRNYAMFAGAQPEFWWATVLIFFLYFKLHLFPAPLGLVGPGTATSTGPTQFILIDSLLHGNVSLFADALSHLALPVVSLSFGLVGPLLKTTRQVAAEQAKSDYIFHLRACGRSKSAVRRAILRNSLPPVMTLAGLLLGLSLGGAVLIETIFSLNGLGAYTVNAIISFDYPAIEGAIAVITILTLLIYTTVDLLHTWLDPRVRIGSR